VRQVVLDVVAEDPEEQHVAQQVHQAAVHEHRSQQRQIDAARRRLQLQRGTLVPDFDDDGTSHVLAGPDLLRHRGQGVGEDVVRPEPLKKGEDDHVDRNQCPGDVRRPDAAGVVVAEWQDHAAAFDGAPVRSAD
jgi:hypothetical protein